MTTDLKSFIPLNERYNPTSFSDLEHSKKTNTILNKLSKNIQNILLYGTAGCGKYTRLKVLIQDYSNNILKIPLSKCKPRAINIDTGYFTNLPSSKSKIKEEVIFCMTSNIHCEIEINQNKSGKGLIKFLEYYSKTKNIKFNIKKIVILRNIEYLKKELQLSLRRLIEISSKNIIYLMTTRSLLKIIKPLKSRFLCLSVQSPTIDDTYNIINSICTIENKNVKDINKIINYSKFGSSGSINLHLMFLSLEGTFILKKKVYIPERVKCIMNLIESVKSGDMMNIRNNLYKIYETKKKIFIDIIINDFYREFIIEIKDKSYFTEITAKWSSIISQNFINNPLFHSEAYMFEICKIYQTQ